MKIRNKSGGVASIPTLSGTTDIPNHGTVNLFSRDVDGTVLNTLSQVYDSADLYEALASGDWRVVNRRGEELDVSAGVAVLEALGPQGLGPEISNLEDPPPTDEGSPISYAVVASTADAKYMVLDDDGTGVTIDRDTGVMAGGESAAPGSYTIKVLAADVFGLSETYEFDWTVNPFTLGRENMFGDQAACVLNADPNVLPIDGLAYLGNGCVSYNGAYELDLADNNYANATDWALYYDAASEVLVAARTNTINTSVAGVYSFTGVSDVSDGALMPSPDNTLTTDASIISTLETNVVMGSAQPWGDRQTHLQGGGYFLEITPSAGILDDFGTDNAGWAYGFTLAEDWICTASAMQLLGPRDPADGAHLFGVSTYFIGTTMYDRVSYGDFSWGPYSTSVGVNLTITDALVAAAGTQVQVRFDGTTYRVYFDGVEVISTTSPVTYMSAVSTTDPVIALGSLVNSDLVLDEESPGAWAIQLEDLWIANNTAISAADLVEMAAHSGDMASSDHYGDVDVYCQFAVGSTSVVKGTVTLSRGSN